MPKRVWWLLLKRIVPTLEKKALRTTADYRYSRIFRTSGLKVVGYYRSIKYPRTPISLLVETLADTLPRQKQAW